MLSYAPKLHKNWVGKVIVNGQSCDYGVNQQVYSQQNWKKAGTEIYAQK